jgi:hypothetical protein
MSLAKKVLLIVSMSLASAAISHAAPLVHAYDFSSDVTDSVGSADGVLLNGAKTNGGALLLDGVDDYVQFSSHIIPSSGSMSVAFWARQDSRASGKYVEFISQGFSGGPGFYLGHDPSGVVRVTDLASNTSVQSGAVGDWVHYALTVDLGSSSTLLYMDGAQVWSSASAFQTGTGGTDTRLGRQFSPFDEFLHGAMDDLLIYAGSLTIAEVRQLYESGRSDGTIPEPGTAGLMVIAVLGLVASSRRRAR